MNDCTTSFSASRAPADLWRQRIESVLAAAPSETTSLATSAGERRRQVGLMTALVAAAAEFCPELDFFDEQAWAAAAAVARWQTMGGEDSGALVEHCRERLRRDALRQMRGDPFSLRHLLTFGTLSPVAAHVAAPLDAAVRRNDTRAIHAVFVELGRLGRAVGSLGPIRQRLQRDARENEPGIAAFALELAVLESRLYGEMGWENARAGIALIAALEPACNALLRDYLEQGEVEVALRVTKRMQERIPGWHFGLVRGTWSCEPLAALHQRVRMKASIPLPALVLEAPIEAPQQVAPAEATVAAAREVNPWLILWRRLLRRRMSRDVPAGLPSPA